MKRLIKERWGYFFLLPWFVFFLIFTLYPFVFGVSVSFTNYNLSGMKFTGLQNYLKILTDTAFQRSLVATLCYAVIIIPLVLVLSLWIAKTIHQRSNRTNSFVKAAFYLPGITTQSAMSIVWKFMFMPTFGIASILLSNLGMKNVVLLENPSYAIPLIAVLIVLCGLGQPIILFSAAMNGIPQSYYEVAEIEGASSTQTFFKVTLPLLHSTTTYVLITNTIGILQLFTVTYLMTGGGPGYRTSTLLMLIYNSAFMNGNFGYASAIGNVLFVITCIAAVIQFRVMRREVVEY